MSSDSSYYVPESSKLPIFMAFGLLLFVLGAGSTINDLGKESSNSYILLMTSFAVIWGVMFVWFSNVINENNKGMYSDQLNQSFVWGMAWFIFSEVMFFAAFFGALYYARELSLPWLGGEGYKTTTNIVLWPQFETIWPSNGPTNTGGDFTVMRAGGIPAINTLLLLTSGLTVTYAHHALKKQDRKNLIIGLAATIALGFIFVGFQAYEYMHAYSDLNLKMTTGIYGSTFYMLTGFHGFHVTLGAIMLTVILFRCIKGHFAGDNHFGFEAVAWYWHFVDVVWLGLFVFVYWL